MRIPLALAILVLTMVYSSPLSRHLSAGGQNPTPFSEEESKVSDAENESKKTSSLLNAPLKTAGGTQLWTDHRYRDGYRIQQNALTSHWRLLDSKDVRRTWGTRAHCESMLDELKPRAAEPETPKHVVVLVHGLMRTHHSMKPLESGLAEEGSMEVIRFSYASSRSSIGDHAVALREVLEDFPANTRFSFIGHSMGNIVVRHVVGDLQAAGDPKRVLGRCRSMVMLGPPNQGAAIARRLAPTGLYEIITGKGGMELGAKWDEFVQNLATPPFPFAIIAGDLSENSIQNPLVDGSSDFVVSVEEAQLEGSESFKKVGVLHSFLMSDDAVRNLTIDFIKSH